MTLESDASGQSICFKESIRIKERKMLKEIRNYHKITDDDIMDVYNQVRFNEKVSINGPFSPLFSQLGKC